MSRHGFPVPAVAAGMGPFRVAVRSVLSGGACALPQRGLEGFFSAPLDNQSLQAIAIRQHEYGHLALEGAGIVPPRVLMHLVGKHRIDEGWAQAGLDVIVNGFMLASGADEIVHLEPCPMPIPTGISRSDAAMLSLRSTLLSCCNSVAAPLAAIGNFDATEQKLLADIAAELATMTSRRKRITTGDIAIRLRVLQTVFGPHDHDPHAGDRTGTSDSQIDPVLKNQLISITRGGNPKWGEMEMLHRPLERLYSSARRALRHRPSYTGPFRYAHRACLPAMDGRVFRTKAMAAGGTALIDCSGSMQLALQDLKKILDASPAATVAAYSGLPNDIRRGWLCVVARNGRMADLASLASYMGSRNVIDAPALRWLKTQKPPYFWISDGLVNGIGGLVSLEMVLDVVDIVRSERIKRYANLGSLVNAYRR